MPTMVFKMRTILHLLTMVWMLDLGLGQGTCGEDSVTVISPSLPDIEGCYFRGNYTSNDRDVYTNDGGEVQSGITLAFMVQYLNPEEDSNASWILSRAVDHGSGVVDNDGYICIGLDVWSTIYNPAEIDTWICDGDDDDDNDDDDESAEVSCGCVADDDTDTGPTPSTSSSSPREETPEPSPAPIVPTILPSVGSSGESSSPLPPTASDFNANTPEPSQAPVQGVASMTSAPTQVAYPYPSPTAAYVGDTRGPSTVPPTPGDSVAISSSMPTTGETGENVQLTLSPLSPCSDAEWGPTPAPGPVSSDSQTPAPTVRVRCGFQLFGTYAPVPTSSPTSGSTAVPPTANPTASPSSVRRTPEPSPSPIAASVAPTMFGTSVSREFGSTSSPTTVTQSPTISASPISGDEASAAPSSPVEADTTSGATGLPSQRSVAVALICGIVSCAALLVMS